jgi:hypothetical protein
MIKEIEHHPLPESEVLEDTATSVNMGYSFGSGKWWQGISADVSHKDGKDKFSIGYSNDFAIGLGLAQKGLAGMFKPDQAGAGDPPPNEEYNKFIKPGDIPEKTIEKPAPANGGKFPPDPKPHDHHHKKPGDAAKTVTPPLKPEGEAGPKRATKIIETKPPKPSKVAKSVHKIFIDPKGYQMLDYTSEGNVEKLLHPMVTMPLGHYHVTQPIVKDTNAGAKYPEQYAKAYNLAVTKNPSGAQFMLGVRALALIDSTITLATSFTPLGFVKLAIKATILGYNVYNQEENVKGSKVKQDGETAPRTRPVEVSSPMGPDNNGDDHKDDHKKDEHKEEIKAQPHNDKFVKLEEYLKSNKVDRQTLEKAFEDPEVKAIMKKWGPNQMEKHLFDKEPSRLVGLEGRGGLNSGDLTGIYLNDPNKIINSIKNFDKLAEKVMQNPTYEITLESGKKIYWQQSTSKGIGYIADKGKSQSLMIMTKEYFDGLLKGIK